MNDADRTYQFPWRHGPIFIVIGMNATKTQRKHGLPSGESNKVSGDFSLSHRFLEQCCTDPCLVWQEPRAVASDLQETGGG